MNISNKNKLIFVAAFLLLNCLATNSIANESINPYLIYYGKAPKISAQTVPVLAKYDLLVVDRYRYREVNGNTWGAIKAISPDTKIFIYQLGPSIAVDTDSVPVSGLNNLGRYNVSRGSSEGSINKNHPDWFLKNKNGSRVNTVMAANHFALDYGNPEVANYWAKHTIEDIALQEWRADGIFIDGVMLCNSAFLKNRSNDVPAKYSDCASWNANMSKFLLRVSGPLQQKGQALMINSGNTINEEVVAVWQELSRQTPSPDIMFEEGAFAVSWGDAGDVKYWPVKQWKQQVDSPSNTNRHVAQVSHTELAPGESGTSRLGEATSHSQIMRFAVGSYMLGRNASGPATYFSFDDNRKLGDFQQLKSADIYDEFDLGSPVAKYEKKLPDQDLYFRKYSRGYVYVNPSSIRIARIKAESDAEFNSKLDNAQKSGSEWHFDLKPHDAAIIRSKDGDTKSKQSTPPQPPVLRTQ